jgi:broad specificity phosphatase PhoE
VNRVDPIVVTVLRHGAVAGRAHVFRGALDDPLSAQGMEQMQRALGRFSPSVFDAVATSPLRRCHEFAAAYAARHDVPLQVLPQFRELAFGDWEGLSPEEAAALHPAECHAFQSTHGAHAPPNGESLAQLRARASRGWHDWLGQDGGTSRLLVTHAGVMRALLMELFGFSATQAFQVALPEAASLRISWLHEQPPFLLSIN